MPERVESPYRTAGSNITSLGGQHEVKLLWEGPLYGPHDRCSAEMSERCRVRVVKTFKQVNDSAQSAQIVQINEVEVTISRDKLGSRVWRPACEMGDGDMKFIIAAVAMGVPD